MSAKRVLYDDAHVTLSIEDGTGLVRYVRSSERFGSVDDARAVHEKIADVDPAVFSDEAEALRSLGVGI